MSKPVFRTNILSCTAIVLALAFTSATAVAAAPTQQKDDLFTGTERFAKGAKDTTEVNLDKNMLALASKGQMGAVGSVNGLGAIADMSKMDSVFVHSYEYARPGSYKMADVEAFRKRLDDDGWSHVVKERSDKESTDVCVKTDREGQMTELVVIDAEPLELNFVHLKGHMSMSDLMKAGQQYGAPGGAAPKASDKTSEMKHLKHRESGGPANVHASDH